MYLLASSITRFPERAGRSLASSMGLRRQYLQSTAQLSDFSPWGQLSNALRRWLRPGRLPTDLGLWVDCVASQLTWKMLLWCHFSQLGPLPSPRKEKSGLLASLGWCSLKMEMGSTGSSGDCRAPALCLARREARGRESMQGSG